MAKLSVVPFAVQEGATGIVQNSSERLTNMYAEVTTSGRSRIVRRQRACLRSVYALTGEKRCIERHLGVHYLIVGGTLYSFNGTTLTTLATLSTTSGRCTMAFNDNDQILISDGQLLRYWNGTTLTTVGGTASFTPGNVAYINGYGIVNSSGTGQFFSTTADDFSAIDALDFATAESNPDALQTVFVDHNDIFLAGTSTIEVWQDTGGVDFPFQSIPSAKIERGTAAPLSFAAEDNTVAFLGDDLIVYRLDAYRPTRISNHAVEEAIRGVSAAGRAAADAFVYTVSGHKFYTLTFPGELTVQYNYATGFWNRATTYGKDSWNVIGSAGRRSDYVLTDAGICELTPDLNQD